MKTEKDIEETKKGFDTVKTFREIKDRISADLYGKSNEQIKEYLQAHLNIEKQVNIYQYTNLFPSIYIVGYSADAPKPSFY